jgi:hypothetical protein
MLGGRRQWALQFLGQLPAFRHRSVTAAEARIEVAARLARRETDFLAHVRLAVRASGSPYRDLLRARGNPPRAATETGKIQHLDVGGGRGRAARGDV